MLTGKPVILIILLFQIPDILIHQLSNPRNLLSTAHSLPAPYYALIMNQTIPNPPPSLITLLHPTKNYPKRHPPLPTTPSMPTPIPISHPRPALTVKAFIQHPGYSFHPTNNIQQKAIPDNPTHQTLPSFTTDMKASSRRKSTSLGCELIAINVIGSKVILGHRFVCVLGGLGFGLGLLYVETYNPRRVQR